MDGSTVYVCDSDALINIQRHFPRKMQKIRELASAGRLTIPEGVARELKRGTDRLVDIVTKWEKQESVVVAFDSDAQLKIELEVLDPKYGDRIVVGEQTYRGFWASAAGRKAADGQVVAIGKVRGFTVVSNDQSVLYACMLENVTCIVWTEFARRLGLMKTGRQPQLPL
jgi:hypothetical protein